MNKELFYGDNLLYKYISENAPKDFLFYDNRLSLMFNISSGINFNFILLDDRSEDLDEEYLSKCENIVEGLSSKLEIPVVWIKYAEDKKLDNNSEVIFKEYDFIKCKWIESIQPLKEFKTILSKYGITSKILSKPKFNSTTKAINSKESSFFHLWQRDFFDANGFIIDVDLIRVNNKNEIQAIYELKRSHTDFVSWLPYNADKNNYLSLAKLCDKIGVRFNIIFNTQYDSKLKDSLGNKIYKDNIDFLKIFGVYHKVGYDYVENSLLFQLEGLEPKENFISKDLSISLKDNVIHSSTKIL